MDTRVRTTLQTMKSPAKHDNKIAKSPSPLKKGKEKQLSPSSSFPAKSVHPRSTSRERKMALQQDVDKLKKKLRHEENVHRALERAFTRPLGALPRLPPYLPPNTLELLAEVAVLEEEVVRLEEQVVNFRQGLYQEAVYISSSKKSVDNTSDSCEQQNPPSQVLNFDTTSTLLSHSHLDELPNPPSHRRLSSCPPLNGKKNVKKNASSASFSEGKENLLSSNSAKKYRQMSIHKPTKNSASTGKKHHMESNASEKCSDPIQLDIRAINQEKPESIPASGNGKVESKQESPNKTSEDVLKCLMTIFSRMSGTRAGADSEMLPYACGLTSQEGAISTEFRDPYGMCAVLGEREIGPYKKVQMIELSSLVADRIASSSLLVQRLKILLGSLASVDLRGLTHQQKLAFWINVYNSCMMNAYLEHGIPGSPQMVVALMQKATINVGGHLLNAMTIEHFILRLPYSKFTNTKCVKNDEATMRTIFALDWPEPLVTFALSCGSWSSPAVRVYSAVHVENELEMAKRDYLQAAVAISSTKVAIPKLLHWYLLDFAKDVESLLDWICLQLPSEMRKEAIKCLERGKKEEISQWLHVIPYEFCFRYLLSP